MLRKYSMAVVVVILFLFFCISGRDANATQEEMKVGDGQTPHKEKVEGAEDRFQKVLEDLHGTVSDRKTDSESKRRRIKEHKGKIDALDQEIRQHFSEVEKRLKTAKLPNYILERHRQFVKNYDNNLADLKKSISIVVEAKEKAEPNAEIEMVKQHLKMFKAPLRHQSLDPNNLTHRQPKAIKREPRVSKQESEKELMRDTGARGQKQILIASTGTLYGLLANQVPQPVSGDLAETIDIQFTPEIQAKAQELGNDPVKIFEWVRNNVEFIPTWGAVQGAQATLLTQQGNAFDTASLLIALLRVSGISAHYAWGTIELPIETVKKWAGGFTDSQAALNFFASGGTPGAGIIENGSLSKARLEHVWVEAYVPYGNYRGTRRDDSSPIWIPLDASFKLHSITGSMGITTIVPFNQDAYLSNLNSLNPLQYYQSQIQSYFSINAPDKTLVDAKAVKKVIEEPFGFLPSSLPYKTIAVLNRFSDLGPDSHNTVTFKLATPNDIIDLSYAATSTELAGKRVTLSYRPATADDEAVVAAYGGVMYDVPAYLIQIKPELRVDGRVVGSGTPTTIGQAQRISLELNRLAGR
jgi:hypothetical protein